MKHHKKDESKLIESWKKDEATPFEGWDFSYIENRKSETKESWNYDELAKRYIAKASSVLDMGTGGGERLAALTPLPQHTIAIEGYKPNVKVARKRLQPLGVNVFEVNEAHRLPFEDGEFDLVLNRNSAFMASEVSRILKPGGIFLTQQVEGSNLEDLSHAFNAESQFKDWTLKKVKHDIASTRLELIEAKNWEGKIEFSDVGAIVYFLKAIPWLVEGFNVQNHLEDLLKLQKKRDEDEKLAFVQKRFLVIAQKS